MDPFVSLTAAAIATKTLKVATGVCLVQQRDPIQTAKLVASIDQVSGGRFLFGVGGGWNAEEMADHGTEFRTRFKLMRERIEAMKEIWTKTEGRIPRRDGRFSGDDGLAEAGPEAAPADPRRRRLPACRAPRDPLWRRLGPDCRPRARWQSRPSSCRASDRCCRSRPRPAIGAGYPVRRDRGCRPAWPAIAISGIARVVVMLPSAKSDAILPILDRWAELIRRVRRTLGPRYVGERPIYRRN